MVRIIKKFVHHVLIFSVVWNGTFSLFRVLWFFCVLQFAGKRALAKLLGNLLLVQEKLLEQNPDTASVLIPGTDVKQSSAHGSNDDDDEEIPSDTEDEKSDDDDVGENSKDENMDEGAENSLKLPAKRKHEMVSFSLCADISGFLFYMSLFRVKQRK